MNARLSAIVLLFVLLASCTQAPPYGPPVAAPNAILKNIVSFLRYREQYVKLYEDFTALDATSNTIDKKMFLQQLASGDYLPLRLQSTGTTRYYRLYKLDRSVDEDIRSTIRDWGKEEYAYYMLEGKKLPDYRFVDMDGKVYTGQTTRGKILVLKCWFLDCLPCRQEMPALNELKRQYKDRNDILFVSICWDPRKEVATFLRKTRFDYAVVPEQRKYLTETLRIDGYPTHFVVDKQGLIVRKTGDYRAMAYQLKKESSH